MVILIKGGTLFSPAEVGKRDILIVAGKIIKVEENIDLPDFLNARVVSAEGMTVVPGFIDLHVHLLGGGGEGGPSTRVPEINLASIISAGVTTVIGCLGLDDISRNTEALLAKAMQLEDEGISAFIYSGSYQIPLSTITGSIKKDIFLIPKVIGVGEIAVSDHRSSQLSFKEFCRVAADARTGGMLGKKAGLVHIHIGHGIRKLDLLFRIVKETEIPVSQFLPTHLARTKELLKEAIRFAKMGGNIDFTVPSADSSEYADALKDALKAGVPIDRITLSSDSNGSIPVFDKNGNLSKLSVGNIANLHMEFRRLIKNGIPIEQVLQTITSNPAKRAGIYEEKGSIESGKDADIVVLDQDLRIRSVIARGKMMINKGEMLVKGTFEV